MPTHEPQPQVWSVSELTRKIKRLLEDNVSHVWVSGEISNFRVSPAGHSYFTLKDQDSQIDAVMFRGRLAKLKFEPESGLDVIAYGLVSVYERRGNYQIICEELQPKGIGALQLAFEKLRTRLAEEGLFDEDKKKTLPMVPTCIGIVTSPTGAAIRDILNVIRRRYANVHILLYPTRVQGDEAAPEIAKAVKALDSWGVDVMIVGRGGGSLEDLWPFNEEVVVRAIYEAKTPVISAVGHEIDFTLADFAADVRAATPSAAAELVVREQAALMEKVQNLQRQACRALERRLELARNRIRIATSSYVFQRPEELVRQRRQQTDELRARLENATADQIGMWRRRIEEGARAVLLLSPRNQLIRAAEGLTSLRRRLFLQATATAQHARTRLRSLAAQLDALSPLSVLSRGYSLTRKTSDGSIVRDSDQLAVNESIDLRFARGRATAKVISTKPSAS